MKKTKNSRNSANFWEIPEFEQADTARKRKSPRHHADEVKVKVQKENYGYACLTNENAFYIENYPQIIIEKAAIDEIVTMLSGGDEQC